MMETQRYTAVVRSTRSNNYYQLPVSPTASVASDMSEHFMSSGSTWATSSMRSITSQNVDLNSSFLNSSQSSNASHTTTPQFQPAFAFDVNQLVNSLRRSTSVNALSSSQRSTTTSSVSSSPGRRENSIASLPRVDSRIQILPVEPVLNRRGRRGAMAGDGEFSRTRLPEQNSIINYKHMKRMAPPPSVRQKMHDQMQKSKQQQTQPQPEPSPPREFVIVKQDFPLAKMQQPEIAAVPLKLQQQQQQYQIAAVPDEPNPHDDRDSLYGDSYTF